VNQINFAVDNRKNLSGISAWIRIALCFVLFPGILVACSSDSVDIANDVNANANANDGLDTTVFLRGTVNETELALNNTVDVKSSDAQRTSFTYNANGEYSADQLPGTGPWLLRVELDQNRSLYGIAYTDSTRNINSFSDISLRRWFALESMDLDEEFASNQPIQRLPSSTEYDVSVTSIFVLIDLVLASYDVSGSDVISTPYVNNDQGVDRFLNRNSVVLEDGLVTFQITDPDTEIRSETATLFELASNLAESGQPPTTPGSVRAISSEQNSIRLVWEPSVDDVGVVGYVVLRDETLLGTTPYPQFEDSNPSTTNATSQYVVVAIDGAGNSSTPSTPVAGSVNTAIDTIAPPPPTQLSLLSNSDTAIRLEWIAPIAADIASFNIYRSILNGTTSFLQVVAIAQATDTDIRDEVLYCYLVTAVDGNNNESQPSNEICTPDEIAPSTDNNPPLSVPITEPNPTNNPFAQSTESVGEWTIVDADALDCTNTLTQDQLTVGRTELTSGCFFVPENLVLNSGSTLRLGQGVVLQFERDAMLSVVGGTLTALGTLDNPVLFTGIDSEPGSWGGIEFFSNSTGNALDGVVIQYGGGGDVRAAVSTRQTGARFRMSNTLVRRNEGSALSFNSSDIRVEDFNGNRIQDNDQVGDVIATELITLVGNTEYIDNDVNIMSITRRAFDDVDIVIPAFPIVVSWAGIEIDGGSLTILPGANLEMVGRSIEVDGAFSAVGTQDQPIIISGRPQSTVGWEGIVLSGAGNKEFNHAFIIGAGENSATTGAIEIDCTRGAPFSFNISNTEIIDSEGWGIFAEGGACSYNIGPNVTFTNVAFGESSIP